MIATVQQYLVERARSVSPRAMPIGAGLLVILAVASALLLGLANPSGAAVENRVSRIAKAASGGFSDAALRSTTAQMDPAMLALARRYDPLFLRSTEPLVALDQAPLLSSSDVVDPDGAKQAVSLNASLPFSTDPNPAARPFTLAKASELDRSRAIQCMTQAIYYEAGFEPLQGEQAVAQVVINRVRHPAFPKTICGVVFQGSDRPTGCQFSFTCDGALGRPPAAAAWERAKAVAVAALSGKVMAEVGGATHYHTDWVAPYWAPHLYKVRQIGAHIFYRWPGGWGLPAAFNGRYAGLEQPGVDLGGDPNKLDLADLKLAGLEGAADAASAAGQSAPSFTLAAVTEIQRPAAAIAADVAPAAPPIPPPPSVVIQVAAAPPPVRAPLRPRLAMPN